VTVRPIYVTRPSLPPLTELQPLLEEIWNSGILTNGGPLHVRLESELAAYLGVGHLSLFNNATVALITALQALELHGEVITTPYSFVATANSVLWNGLTPVFVDVDAETLNLDPARIEAAITTRTTAILPVHCYGRPCDVTAIADIASRHGLRVLYDAAHAFGVRRGGESVLRHGDLSVLSFHATKVFNTFEGGAIVSPDAMTKRRIDQLKNFGFVDEVTVHAAGINGKLNELQAAVGLLQLQHYPESLSRRAAVDSAYRQGLMGIRGVRALRNDPEWTPNYSYFPVMVGSECKVTRDALYEELRERQIFARRYFYPLISAFPMYRELSSALSTNLPVAEAAAEQVLCLPIYPELDDADIARVIGAVREVVT
jgi:dTDP-4-amino-4,6-dideoxygalactose transaminase